MEGVMMKNQEKYAVAVRKPDHEIEVKVSEYTGIIKNKKIRNMPILRGVFSFIESLVLGMQTLTYSASFFEDEEVDEKKKEPMTEEERRRQEQKEKKQENAMMGGTVVLSIVLAVAVFMMLPYYLSTLFQKVITSQWVIALLEGVIRLVIFIGYVALISLMKDIRRVYMYHGAEHKCINCIEHGMDLTVDNVRKSSRFHKRCGTSFLLIVMLVSILFFTISSYSASSKSGLSNACTFTPPSASLYGYTHSWPHQSHLLISLLWQKLPFHIPLP